MSELPGMSSSVNYEGPDTRLPHGFSCVPWPLDASFSCNSTQTILSRCHFGIRCMSLTGTADLSVSTGSVGRAVWSPVRVRHPVHLSLVLGFCWTCKEPEEHLVVLSPCMSSCKPSHQKAFKIKHQHRCYFFLVGSGWWSWNQLSPQSSTTQ